MRNGTPPPGSRSPRGGDPGASGRRLQNPYMGGQGGSGSSSRVPSPRRADPGQIDDPYNPGTGTRMPTLGPSTLYAAAMGRREELWTSSRLQAVQAHKHRIGIAIFHDGNPGHLWRGEIASRFGEVLVDAGAVMWLATLLQSPVLVALVFLALGLPFLLVGPFGAKWENARRPGAALKWVNNLRIVLVLVLIALYFHTILLAIYAVLFLLSLCGRLHDALRTGAIRSCLAPGEPEHVANDIYIGGVVAAVFGPMLATLLYVLVGERFLVVAIVAAVAFLVSGNSEGLLDTLPPGRRAFLLATPEALYPNGEVPALAYEPGEIDEMDDDEWREESLPAWYQQGPTTTGEAISELRAGFGLAGTSAKSRLALWGLSGLALAGGAFSILMVFYITGELGLPTFYLGPFIAAEGAGLVLGSLTLSSQAGGEWRGRLWFGLVATGVLFAALSIVVQLLVGLLIAFFIGYMTALAVAGARRALYMDFDPVEQRSITSAENWVAAFGGVMGAVLVGLFLSGTEPPSGLPEFLKSLPGWSTNQMLILLGLGLIVASFLLMGLAATQKNRPQRNMNSKVSDGRRTSTKERARGGGPDEDGWDTDGDGGWGDHGDDFAASAAYQYDQHDESGYATGYRNHYGGVSSTDALDEENDQPPSRSARRPGNQKRPRW